MTTETSGQPQILRSDLYDQWQNQFTQERLRLSSALGSIPEGGIVEDMQHIGSTSVHGLAARPCIDIAISIWPFPLQAGHLAKLAALGYEPLPHSEDPLEQRLRHTSGGYQLFMIEAGSGRWTDYHIMRDYWRAAEDARRQYSVHKQEWERESGASSPEYQLAKERFFRHALEEARQWWIGHRGFAGVEAAAGELQGYKPGWYIAGGWALDLFLGQVTRVHHDVDIVVARLDQPVLQQHLLERGWKLMTPWQGKLEPWPLHMTLEPLRHQVHAFRDGSFLDFQLSDIAQGIWRYRRDPAVTRSIERAGLRSRQGIPYLAPELVLLFKSKNTSGRERPKDKVDFQRVYPYLEPERRAWLLWAVTVVNPSHPWLENLAGGDWREGQDRPDPQIQKPSPGHVPRHQPG
jgi:GrpB-like predicted nucleotidyltransferase (UPF0157 family)